MGAQKRLLTIVFAVLWAWMAWSCGAATDETDEKQGVQQEDLQDIQDQMEGFIGEDAYEQNFEKPHVETHIYIDQTGYDVSDTKTAYFTANGLAPDFTVYRAQDNEPVFVGRMRETAKDPLTEMTVYKGDFSQVTEPGTYYIQTAVIGRSYSFTIEEKHYEKLRQCLSERLLSQTSEDFFTGGGKEDPGTGLMNLLRMCAACGLGEGKADERIVKKIGAHAGWLIENGEKSLSGLKTEERYLLAAALSQAAQVLAGSDETRSDECLKAARSAYGEAEKDDSEGARRYRYMAAAALYKASGSADYHAAVRDIFEKSGNKIETYDSAPEFWAAYFYMTAERQVDEKICETMMSGFMAQCAGFLDQSAGGAYGLTRRLTEESDIDSRILQDAMQLAVADYTIVSREYRNVCRQQIHHVLHDRDTDSLSDDEAVAMWFILCIIVR